MSTVSGVNRHPNYSLAAYMASGTQQAPDHS